MTAATSARARLFDALAEKDVVIDMVSQGAPRGDKLDISFSLSRDALHDALAAIGQAFPDGENPHVDVNDPVVKLVVAGPGMEHQAGVTSRLFDALAREAIGVYAVSTSETKIACCVDKGDAQRAKQAIAAVFSL